MVNKKDLKEDAQNWYDDAKTEIKSRWKDPKFWWTVGIAIVLGIGISLILF